MKQTVDLYDFRRSFEDANRSDNFSYQGKEALFNYLEELEESCGIEIELDIIGICCDFSEYETLEEFQSDYGSEYETLEDIENMTIVIKVDENAFIIQSF